MSTEGGPAGTWVERVSSLNDLYAETVAETMDAQGRVVEAWLDSLEDATSQERADESVEALFDVYGVWMQAARDSVEELTDAMEGEDVPVERFRDIWLTAANRAFKEVMWTSAFADAVGESTDDVLEFRRRLDEVTEATLHELGLPTEGDVAEVGERLVELERRQHALEERIEDALDAVETEE